VIDSCDLVIDPSTETCIAAWFFHDRIIGGELASMMAMNLHAKMHGYLLL
jgi:hypothetical protein